MRALGFSLNNMTMLALSLATGIVIDDAIVVLENIFRYIEEKGATPQEAAIKATAGDRPGGHGDDAVAGRHLRAGGVHDRPGRPLLLQLRHHLGDGHHALDVRVVHADAGAVRVVAAAAGRAPGSRDEHQAARLLRVDGPEVRAHAGVVAPPPRADARRRRRHRRLRGRPLSLRRQGAGAGRRPERVQREPAAAERHELRADARVHDAD